MREKTAGTTEEKEGEKRMSADLLIKIEEKMPEFSKG